MSSWHHHIPWAYLQKHQKHWCCTDADTLLLMVLADVFQSLLGCPLQHEAVWIGEDPNKTNYVWVVQWAQLVQFISHIAVVFGKLCGTVAGCVIITIEDLHSYLCFASVSLLGTMTDNKMCSYTSLLTRNINNRTRNYKRHLNGGISTTHSSLLLHYLMEKPLHYHAKGPYSIWLFVPVNGSTEVPFVQPHICKVSKHLGRWDGGLHVTSWNWPIYQLESRKTIVQPKRAVHFISQSDGKRVSTIKWETFHECSSWSGVWNKVR